MTKKELEAIVGAIIVMAKTIEDIGNTVLAQQRIIQLMRQPKEIVETENDNPFNIN